MKINEHRELLAEKINKIQEEDLHQVMDNLGITLEEAKDKLLITHYGPHSYDVEYMISDIRTLEVYKHRKIDFGLFGTYRGVF